MCRRYSEKQTNNKNQNPTKHHISLSLGPSVSSRPSCHKHISTTYKAHNKKFQSEYKNAVQSKKERGDLGAGKKKD